jgi:biotin carboxyl carrier protein
MNGKSAYTIQINGTPIEVQIDQANEISVEGISGYQIDWVEVDPNRFSLLLNGKSYSMTLEQREDGSFIANINGKEYHCTVEDERSKRLREYIVKEEGTDGPIEITAPMPGMVIEINVQEGAVISESQPLAVLEAMKMENEIRSNTKGTIIKIHIQTGQAVEKGQPLVTIMP